MNTEKNATEVVFGTQEDGFHFKGLLASYDTVDRDNDIFLKGCFKEDIQNRERHVLLYNHDKSLNSVIGYFDAKETERGVEIEGKFLDGDDLGNKIKNLVQIGAFQTLSIGFGVEHEKDVNYQKERNGFDIKKAFIREGSIVITPANPNATINVLKSVKASIVKNTDEEEQINKLKEEIKKI